MENYTGNTPQKHLAKVKLDKYLALTLLLILFHLIANVIWIYLNKVPPGWDQSLHIYYSMRYLDYLKRGLENFNLVEFLKISGYYPPLVYFVGAIFALIGGCSYKFILLVGSLFFGLSIYFLYRYAELIFQNKKTAFFSAFFFSFFITIYEQSRYLMLDIPLTAFVLGGLLFLEKSNNFRNKKNTLIFFLFFGLACLTKWYSLVFFAIPMIFKLLISIKNKQIKKDSIVNIVLGLLIVSFINLPWYCVNLRTLLNISQMSITPEKADPQTILSLENSFFHLKLIIMFQLSFIGFLFFLFSSYLLAVDKENKRKIFIFVTIIFCYLIFTIIGNKNIRYLFPLMPFFALVMGYGLDRVLRRGKSWTISFASLIIFYYIFSYLILSFGLPVYPRYKKTIDFPLLGWTDIYYLHYYPVRVIFEDNGFKYRELIKDIYGLKKGKIRVLLLINTEYVNNGTLNPYLYKEFSQRKNDIEYLNNILENKSTSGQIKDFLDKETDAILIPKRNIGLAGGLREYDSLFRFQQYIFSDKFTGFERVKEYFFYGNEFFPSDTYTLYKKQAP